MKTFLVDHPDGTAGYVYADTWEEAERICAEEGLFFLGEHTGTVSWWDMPPTEDTVWH